jgi:hypothetical protein
MARWFVNEFSTTQLVLLGVGGMVVLTIACVVLARRCFPRLTDTEFEPVADSLRVVYELIFALILAFVIASVLDEMSNAESAVTSEATTISELVRANEALPPRVGLPLDDAVGAYVRAVANDEWKTMRQGRESPRASAELDGMYAEYDAVTPKGATQAAIYRQALADLHDVTSKRRERLDIAASDQPTMLRVLVAVGLVLLLVLEYRTRLGLVAALVFMGTLAAVVTSAFLLTVVLDYPFAGQVSVSNDPFKEDNLAQFWDKELAYHGPTTTKPGLTAQSLAGVYDSTAFGTLVLRCYKDKPNHKPRRCQKGDTRMRGVFRYLDGTLTGQVVDGEFRGWWTEESVHPVRDDGQVVFQLAKKSGEPLIAGTYGYGSCPLSHHGWDLEKIGGDTPPDLARRLHTAATFIEKPRGLSHCPARR